MRRLFSVAVVTLSTACTAIAAVEDHPDREQQGERYYSHEVERTSDLDSAAFEAALDDQTPTSPESGVDSSDAASSVDVLADAPCTYQGDPYRFDAAPYACPEIHPREYVSTYPASVDHVKCFDYDARVSWCWIYCCNDF